MEDCSRRGKVLEGRGGGREADHWGKKGRSYLYEWRRFSGEYSGRKEYSGRLTAELRWQQSRRGSGRKILRLV